MKHTDHKKSREILKNLLLRCPWQVLLFDQLFRHEHQTSHIPLPPFARGSWAIRVWRNNYVREKWFAQPAKVNDDRQCSHSTVGTGTNLKVEICVRQIILRVQRQTLQWTWEDVWFDPRHSVLGACRAGIQRRAILCYEETPCGPWRPCDQTNSACWAREGT